MIGNRLLCFATSKVFSLSGREDPDQCFFRGSSSRFHLQPRPPSSLKSLACVASASAKKRPQPKGKTLGPFRGRGVGEQLNPDTFEKRDWPVLVSRVA